MYVTFSQFSGCLSVVIVVRCCCWYTSFFFFTYPLIAKVVVVPQMTSQPVFLILLCSLLPSGTWQTPGLSIFWCCLPTSSSVCLVFFPILCLASWFWPDLMNGRHVHTTSVCVSSRWPVGLRVVRLPVGPWHRLPRWLHGLFMRGVVSCGSTSFPWLVFFLQLCCEGPWFTTIQEDGCDKGAHQSYLGNERNAPVAQNWFHSILKHLHWLPVKARISCKTACLCFNAITASTPVYLSDLHRWSPLRSLCSSADSRLLKIPVYKCKTKGDRAFLVFLSGTHCDCTLEMLQLSTP